MKRLFLLICAALVVAGGTKVYGAAEIVAEPADDSAPKYAMSVLTCAPGAELYSVFGHTGLRVKNLENGEDMVHNFGLFDFDTPHFYLKFIKGDLDYFVGTQRPENFTFSYTYEGRWVREQDLNLTAEQTGAIMEYLDYRMLPENRAYQYKFRARNCTTEVRDLLFDVVDYGEFDMDAKLPFSSRDYINNCLYDMPWVKIGLDFILGSKVDRKMTVNEGMFLPDKFMTNLDGLNNGGVALVSGAEVINGIELTLDEKGNFWKKNYPAFIFFAVLLFALFSRSRITAFVVFLATGLLGTLLTFITFYSEHVELLANYNLLWCNPLYVVLAVTVLAGKRRVTAVCSAICTLGILAMPVIWLMGVQQWNMPFLFWLLILLVLIYKSNAVYGGKAGKGRRDMYYDFNAR